MSEPGREPALLCGPVATEPLDALDLQPASATAPPFDRARYRRNRYILASVCALAAFATVFGLLWAVTLNHGASEVSGYVTGAAPTPTTIPGPPPAPPPTTRAVVRRTAVPPAPVVRGDPRFVIETPTTSETNETSETPPTSTDETSETTETDRPRGQGRGPINVNLP